MKDEKFVECIVKEARMTLRQKLEDYGGIPSVHISYSIGEYMRIKELFSSLKNLAEANHLYVEFLEDKERHLRWSYKFEDALTFSSNE